MSIMRILESRQQDVIACSPQHTVRQAAAIMAEHRIGAMPVLDDGRVVGIFSERDLLYCVAREGETVLGRAVAEVMTAPAITIGSDVDALTAMSLMTRRRIRHLPVVDGAAMLGFVSIGDLVKFRIEAIEAEAGALRDYITLA